MSYTHNLATANLVTPVSSVGTHTPAGTTNDLYKADVNWRQRQ